MESGFSLTGRVGYAEVCEDCEPASCDLSESVTPEQGAGMSDKMAYGLAA